MPDSQADRSIEPYVASDELRALCARLDRTIDWATFDPEDVSRRLALFGEVQSAVTLRADAPVDLPDTSAGRLVLASWYKVHHGRKEVEPLLRGIRDDAAIVRVAAVEALGDILSNSASDGSLDVADATRFKDVIEQQRAIEKSPLLSLKLQELSKVLERPASSRRKQSRFLPRNPYVAGLPIRTSAGFYGRKDVFEEIRRDLDAPGVNTVIIHGERRTGKTSLLYQIANGALGERYFAVYFDLQTVAGLSIAAMLEALAHEVAASLSSATGQALDAPALADDQAFAMFGDWLRQACTVPAPRTLVMLLDEYEVLVQHFSDEDVGRQFQALYEGAPAVSWVFAGAQRLEQQRAENIKFLLDASRYVRMTFLSRGDAARLITEPAREKLTFTDEAIDRIYGLSGGHPFYVQLICQQVFERATSGDTGRVSGELIDRVAEEMVMSPPPHLIISWNALAFDLRAVGTALAEIAGGANQWMEARDIIGHFRAEEFPLRFNAGQVRQKLRALLDSDWLEKRTGREGYRFRMQLARDWIADARSIWDVLNERQAEVFRSVAGAGRQTLAWVIDFGFTAALSAVLAILFAVPAASSDSGMAAVMLAIAGGLAGLALYLLTIFQYLHTTPGQRICGLSVLSADGLPVDRKSQRKLAGVFALRFLVWAAGFLAVVAAIVSLTSPFVLIFFMALLATEAAELLAMRKQPKGRGMYARLARAAVVSQRGA